MLVFLTAAMLRRGHKFFGSMVLDMSEWMEPWRTVCDLEEKDNAMTLIVGSRIIIGCMKGVGLNLM